MKFILYCSQLLILSHGNACVESSFSVNENMLVENLHEKSLLSHRIVYNFMVNGGILEVNVNRNFNVRLASLR